MKTCANFGSWRDGFDFCLDFCGAAKHLDLSRFTTNERFTGISSCMGSHRPAVELRRPKPEAIEALESPDDVVKLKNDDFDYIDPEIFEGLDDQKSK
ncbi:MULTISPECIES: hypothetical protein [unclassified Ruegeria]|uniref:hypothetical protein n=1 Tax=unclassified Ruegeria TaxID=2625375 RepID=UPI001487C7B7|nr:MULTISPECIES: hypothetical protein [unclassified Ruegeria]NOD65809.1 hypothetical protein [Ruegeria sp. HKCCD6109]